MTPDEARAYILLANHIKLELYGHKLPCVAVHPQQCNKTCEACDTMNVVTKPWDKALVAIIREDATLASECYRLYPERFAPVSSPVGTDAFVRCVHEQHVQQWLNPKGRKKKLTNRGGSQSNRASKATAQVAGSQALKRKRQELDNAEEDLAMCSDLRGLIATYTSHHSTRLAIYQAEASASADHRVVEHRVVFGRKNVVVFFNGVEVGGGSLAADSKFEWLPGATYEMGVAVHAESGELKFVMMACNTKAFKMVTIMKYEPLENGPAQRYDAALVGPAFKFVLLVSPQGICRSPIGDNINGAKERLPARMAMVGQKSAVLVHSGSTAVVACTNGIFMVSFLHIHSSRLKPYVVTSFKSVYYHSKQLSAYACAVDALGYPRYFEDVPWAGDVTNEAIPLVQCGASTSGQIMYQLGAECFLCTVPLLGLHTTLSEEPRMWGPINGTLLAAARDGKVVSTTTGVYMNGPNAAQFKDMLPCTESGVLMDDGNTVTVRRDSESHIFAAGAE